MSAIELLFSLPGRDSTARAETGLAETRRWLDGLPVVNPPQAAHQLLDALMALNRSSVTERRLHDLLELYRPAVRDVCDAIARAHPASAQPASDKARIAFGQLRAFETEMAAGYKRVLLALSAQEDADREHLAAAAQRAIHHLYGVLLHCYALHGPAPEGLWRELHQIYHFAEARGVVELPVADALNPCVPGSAVGHVYKQALLTDFADPYHLPGSLLAHIRQYLNLYAPFVSLSTAITDLRPECQFLIDLNNDRAGVVNLESATVVTEVRYRLLGTHSLQRVMQEQYTLLDIGHRPAEDALGSEFYRHHGQGMLERLLTSLGSHPRRRFKRSRTSTGHRVSACFSLPAAHQMINGGSPVQPSSLVAGPMPQRGGLAGAGSPAPSGVPGANPMLTSDWTLTEESAAGFSLSRKDAATASVRISDIVCAHITNPGTAPQSPVWTLSVVRWVRSAGRKQVEIGVERLSPTADPILLLPVEVDERSRVTALRLPPLRPLHIAASLLIPRGLYQPRRLLFLDDGTRSWQIRLGRLIQANGVFEQCEFEHVGT